MEEHVGYELQTEPFENEFDPKAPWRSRRFWIAAATIILDVLMSLWPAVSQVREELIQTITFLGITLVAGFSITHAAGLVTPIWTSRRFWLSVGTLVLDLFTAFWPGVAEIRESLVALIGWLGISMVGGLTLTDVAWVRGWTIKQP